MATAKYFIEHFKDSDMKDSQPFVYIISLDDYVYAIIVIWRTSGLQSRSYFV